ncbi:MAG TPA: hypothetical protein VMG12_44670 [Polyangiaceae bacterium]|nr:hypothetical protein [Polyangiaceae bacterium]
MASIENSSDSVPIPALLIERATALARAEAGLALVHTRRIAIGAVSALLGTIVACAFAQLTLVLLVAWPVIAAHVPMVNLLFGVLASVLISAAAASLAVITWLGVARERRNGSGREVGASRPPAPRASSGDPAAAREAAGRTRTSERPAAVGLPERVSL